MGETLPTHAGLPGRVAVHRATADATNADASERALGISIIYAAQTWRQLAALFGETEARAIFGLTNVLALFGGSKDIGFNREVSDLVGTTRVARTSWQLSGRGGRTASGEDMPILRPEEIRQLPEGQALVIAENTPPILASLRRCIDGKPGRALLDDQQKVRAKLTERRRRLPGAGARAAAAMAAARRHSLPREGDVTHDRRTTRLALPNAGQQADRRRVLDPRALRHRHGI